MTKGLDDLARSEVVRRYNLAVARARQARAAMEHAQDELSEAAGEAALGLGADERVGAARGRLRAAEDERLIADSALTWLKTVPAILGRR